MCTSRASRILLLTRLDFGPVMDDKANWMMFTKCWCHYTMHATSAESTYDHQEQINIMFTDPGKEDEIYPLTVKEIAQAQRTMQS